MSGYIGRMTTFCATFSISVVVMFARLVYFSPLPQTDQDYVLQGTAPLGILVSGLLLSMISSAMVGLTRVLWNRLLAKGFLAGS